jgi:hypothetical protein
MTTANYPAMYPRPVLHRRDLPATAPRLPRDVPPTPRQDPRTNPPYPLAPLARALGALVAPVAARLQS